MERKCIVQHIGTIEIKNGLIVSDPCYGINDEPYTAVNLNAKDFNAGIYDCYVGWVMTSHDNARVAFMTIALDGQKFSISDDLIGMVPVDSGTMMIGDFKEWLKNHNNESANDDWYKENIVKNAYTSEIVFDSGKSFLSSSGYGDGEYPVFAEKCKGSSKISGVMVRFIYASEYEILDFIDSEDEPDFESYE